jgi:isochorismate synthase
VIEQLTALANLLAEGRQRAAARGRPVLVSWTERLERVDPLAVFRRGKSVAAERSFWESPSGMSVAGIGVCVSIPLNSGGAERAWREMLSNALIGGDQDAGPGPILLGALPFDAASSVSPPWAPLVARGLMVPTWQVTVSGDDCRLTINVLVTENIDDTIADRFAATGKWLTRGIRVAEQERIAVGGPLPVCGEPPEEWVNLVKSAKAAIRNGEAEKIVLARSLEMTALETEPAHVLARLRDRYPVCTLFATAHGADCFLGATPERLARLRGGGVQVDALAGTVRRGATPEEDRVLGERLMASPKDRAEHAIVVRTIHEALSECCRDLSVPAEPVLLPLANVQHLHTPLTGRLVTGEGILGLVRRLHPTPAVAGFPRSAALDFLRRHEVLDRGLYAGPVGWLDQHGEGEFAVALRSALLSGEQATLYAGCGIMALSDPRREWEESCLKLRPMLSVLGNAG